MTITTVSAYFLIACYFVMERSLRKGQQSLSLKPGEVDAGSSQVLWISGVVSILLIIAAPVLNTHQIGYWDNETVGLIGLTLMIGGLVMRYWAAKTLGEFYTRTLQVIKGQEIVNQAPYNVIRHPGYLGTLLMEIGAGLAVTNWAVLLALLAIGVTSRAYRIGVEEKMLEANFGEEYKVYSDRTWRLIPFVY
ncbi:MAG: isoprenylcysteine carboxylmethyltransferase family protein [Leptolyngbya sp. BL-A-14]